MNKTAFNLATLLFLIACHPYEAPVTSGPLTKSQATYKAKSTYAEYPKQILTSVDGKRFFMWKVPVERYNFAVIQSKASVLAFFNLRVHNTIDPIQRATGCSIPQGTIPQRSDLENGQRAVIELQC